MFALLALALSPAHADFVSARCSVHGATDRIQVEEGAACAGFEVKTDDGRVFTTTGDDGSGSYLVSADGHVVIFVADYATMTVHGGTLSPDWRTGTPALGVRIYRDGVVVASRTVESLVRPHETESSISHLDWVDAATFAAPITDQWTLTVRSGRKIPFSTRG